MCFLAGSAFGDLAYWSDRSDRGSVGGAAEALDKLRGLAELDDPESLVVPILIDAILMAESYRGARHQITFLAELTRNVDQLIRELNLVETTKEWIAA